MWFRDEFGPRPGPAWPGLGLIEGHFWGLAHLGPGRLILAQVRPGPEKNGPNSTHRDEFRPRPGLAQPGPGLIEGHFGLWPTMGRAGLGQAQVRPGPEKIGPNSSLMWLSIITSLRPMLPLVINLKYQMNLQRNT